MSENLSIWTALGKTDPAHTKGFNRAGGFKGTAIKPIYIQKRLTEQFGPCGIGWGMGEPSFQVVSGDGEILVYCTVSCWHGNRDNVLWGVGGDKVQTKRQGGSFNDDEAFKKAFTDAVGNAFKSIGVGADVHMGLFDDDKYVTAVKAELAAADTPEIPLITNDQRTIIQGLAEKAGTDLMTICKAARIDSLPHLPAAAYEGVITKLKDKIAANSTPQQEAA